MLNFPRKNMVAIQTLLCRQRQTQLRQTQNPHSATISTASNGSDHQHQHVNGAPSNAHWLVPKAHDPLGLLFCPSIRAAQAGYTAALCRGVFEIMHLAKQQFTLRAVRDPCPRNNRGTWRSSFARNGNPSAIAPLPRLTSCCSTHKSIKLWECCIIRSNSPLSSLSWRAHTHRHFRPAKPTDTADGGGFSVELFVPVENKPAGGKLAREKQCDCDSGVGRDLWIFQNTTNTTATNQTAEMVNHFAIVTESAKFMQRQSSAGPT